MKFLTTVILICLCIPILFVMIFTSTRCEHEDTVDRYVFVAYDSTAYSSVNPYCRDCKESLRYTNIQGELVDQSYLSAIQENRDGREIVAGEYYTVTATVPLGYYGSSTSRDHARLTCQVENEGFIVRFSVEFREEFRESIESMQEGEKITFRGRFYDEGCGFTDAELISK